MLGMFRNSMEASVEQNELGEEGEEKGRRSSESSQGCIKEELGWDFLLSGQGSYWRGLSTG